MKTEPYRCYPCSEIMVETEDGNVLGFVGALRFEKDAQAPICPECGKPMVPVRAVNTNNQVERDNSESVVAA